MSNNLNSQEFISSLDPNTVPYIDTLLSKYSMNINDLLEDSTLRDLVDIFGKKILDIISLGELSSEDIIQLDQYLYFTSPTGANEMNMRMGHVIDFKNKKILVNNFEGTRNNSILNFKAMIYNVYRQCSIQQKHFINSQRANNAPIASTEGMIMKDILNIIIAVYKSKGFEIKDHIDVDKHSIDLSTVEFSVNRINIIFGEVLDEENKTYVGSDIQGSTNFGKYLGDIRLKKFIFSVYIGMDKNTIKDINKKSKIKSEEKTKDYKDFSLSQAKFTFYTLLEAQGYSCVASNKKKTGKKPIYKGGSQVSKSFLSGRL